MTSSSWRRSRTGTLPKEDFPHRAHVRLAWIYLGRRRVRGRRRAGWWTASRRSRPPRRAGLYHETVTRTWLRSSPMAAAGRPRPARSARSWKPTRAARTGALDRHYDPADASLGRRRARRSCRPTGTPALRRLYSRHAFPHRAPDLQGLRRHSSSWAASVSTCPATSTSSRCACPRCQAKVDTTWDGEVKPGLAPGDGRPLSRHARPTAWTRATAAH